MNSSQKHFPVERYVRLDHAWTCLQSSIMEACCVTVHAPETMERVHCMQASSGGGITGRPLTDQKALRQQYRKRFMAGWPAGEGPDELLARLDASRPAQSPSATSPAAKRARTEVSSLPHCNSCGTTVVLTWPWRVSRECAIANMLRLVAHRALLGACRDVGFMTGNRFAFAETRPGPSVHVN